MPKTKVLIAVKTYPTLSAKYDELVCTAGFREDGTWIRIYPVPFRKRSYNEQYKKYDWIELNLTKNEGDFRPESYRPVTIDSEIKVIGHIDTHHNWEERKKYALGKIYHNMTELIAEAKNKDLYTSLAVFKPSKVLDFYAEKTDREWDAEKLHSFNQLNLFENTWDEKFEVVKKVPYKFKFKFQDNQGRESNMMIEDWETGQLYWNCLARHEGHEERAIVDVRRKYFDDFAKTKDLHFFLGTTQSYHLHSQNPFMIIGTFTPAIELQGKLF
ncbi:MAG: hypothetical protein C0523_07480 [Cytophaga sp.]|nr:hypothetical protein [Cytophaga sp.]